MPNRLPTRRTANMYAVVPLYAPLFAMGPATGQSQKFMILGVVLGVVVAGLWFFYWLHTRRQREAATLARSNIIRERIQQVIDADGRLEMFPAQRSSNANGQMLIGRCLACSNDSLTLEFALTAEVPDWKHEVVDIYFRLMVDKVNIFYVFTATICAMRTHGGKLTVGMPLPVHLRKEQKRALFRISLPSQMVSALALWQMSPELDAAPEIATRSLGAPLLTGRANRQRHLSLYDISGGGICLEIDKEQAVALKLHLQPGDQFFLLSVFADREGTPEPRQFWFKCMCRHTGKTSQSGNPLIGLQFRAWCMTRQVSDPIVWIPLTATAEVPPLLDMLVNWSRSGNKGTPG